ncbi:MAG: hypothetical protein MUE40_15815 [Anaerolineae bacterium]|jgi:hypothetical protein|nr:hypothetical protein [Anaerolineae bacterium]
MPIQSIDYVPGRVVYSRATGITTVPELLEAVHYFEDQARQTSAPLLHVISDLRQARQMPTLHELVAMNVPQNEKLGWMLIVGSNKFFHFISSVLAGMFKTRFRYYETLEQAIAFLQSVDESLPDLQAPEYRQHINPFLAEV